MGCCYDTRLVFRVLNPSFSGLAKAGLIAQTLLSHSKILSYLYVPSSHELRYLRCSSVRVSMRTPIASSFNWAIWRSIASGTA